MYMFYFYFYTIIQQPRIEIIKQHIVYLFIFFILYIITISLFSCEIVFYSAWRSIDNITSVLLVGVQFLFSTFYTSNTHQVIFPLVRAHECLFALVNGQMWKRDAVSRLEHQQRDSIMSTVWSVSGNGRARVRPMKSESNLRARKCLFEIG